MKQKWAVFAIICVLLLSAFGIVVYIQFGSFSNCPATLSTETVENGTETANETVIEFENLSRHQQQEFERALDNGYTEIESQSNWEYNWIIHHEETYYSITIGIC
ncbi:hypothetical protein NGM10_08305 [Halorussus salilacus]|uniref:hypothetical protein n=1 Tax=Halorussus salilacus TaxID=2953750 RepID=UPI00209D90E6|nr:hypothetical protein [Halorussus salilacus]USZ66743.1 hypothetical protein NGM10_08305 [Halorussus salilacus]